MAEIIDRRYLLLRKLRKLQETHGNIKGTNLFKEEYGQEGIDSVFNFIVACHTPINMQAAEGTGHGVSSCIIPKESDNANGFCATVNSIIGWRCALGDAVTARDYIDFGIPQTEGELNLISEAVNSSFESFGMAMRVAPENGVIKPTVR